MKRPAAHGMTLRRATEIARIANVVTEYGMSEQLGLVTFESNYRSPFLDGYPSVEGAYSDTTAYQIDQRSETYY